MWRELLAKTTTAREQWVARLPFAQSDLARAANRYQKRSASSTFQGRDARPAAYDLVSLGQDARIDIAEQLEWRC